MYIFKKINADEKIVTCVVSFHFYNYIITLPLPLHREDVQEKYGQFKFMPLPPYFLKDGTSLDAVPRPFKREIASMKEITNEVEAF